MYDVIYLCRGERHMAYQCESLADAYAMRADLLANGWQAWVEAVR